MDDEQEPFFERSNSFDGLFGREEGRNNSTNQISPNDPAG